MNNEISIQIEKMDDKLDCKDITNLTLSIGKAINPELTATAGGLENWLKNLQSSTEPKIVKAYYDGELVGWNLVFIHDKTRLEINPWALEGHPFVKLENTNRQLVAEELLKTTIGFARDNGYTRVELSYNQQHSANFPHVFFDKEFYEKNELILQDEIQFMQRELGQANNEVIDFPQSIQIDSLSQANQNELYTCFYDTFIKGQDRDFLNKTDEERKEFFLYTFDMSEELVEKASVVLKENGKIIGFSLVRPTHGERNGNLWMMGIHPRFQQKGLATKLILLMMQTLAKTGYKTMSLVVDKANVPAVKLYEKLLFTSRWCKVTHVWKSE